MKKWKILIDWIKSQIKIFNNLSILARPAEPRTVTYSSIFPNILKSEQSEPPASLWGPRKSSTTESVARTLETVSKKRANSSISPNFEKRTRKWKFANKIIKTGFQTYTLTLLCDWVPLLVFNWLKAPSSQYKFETLFRFFFSDWWVFFHGYLIQNINFKIIICESYYDAKSTELKCVVNWMEIIGWNITSSQDFHEFFKSLKPIKIIWTTGMILYWDSHIIWFIHSYIMKPFKCHSVHVISTISYDSIYCYDS